MLESMVVFVAIVSMASGVEAQRSKRSAKRLSPRVDLRVDAPVALVDECAVTAGGRVVCFDPCAVVETEGFVPPAQTAARTDVSGVAQYAGQCARHADGTVSCTVVTRRGRRTRAQQVAVAGLTEVVDVASNGTTHCAVRATGEVLCWGRNDLGQLGDGTRAQRDAPAPVAGVADAVEVAVGRATACARRRDGRVSCWGANDHGQLGRGSAGAPQTAAEVAGITDAVEVAAGADHVCARRANGEALCWGADRSGQLGRGGWQCPDGAQQADECQGGPDQPTPTPVPRLSGVQQLALTGDETCVLAEGGRVLCWGAYAENSSMDASIASGTPVEIFTHPQAREVAATGYQACARLADGRIWCAYPGDRCGSLGLGDTY